MDMDSENSKRINTERDRGRGPGRPPKRRRISENTGRMRVSIEKASQSTIYRRANELLNNSEYNMATIKLAAKFGKDASASVSGETNSSEQNNLLRHTKESALAFYLEYDYSKSMYEGLVTDSNSRNSSIYPAYQIVKSAMVECQPQNYRISEIEVLVPLQKMLNKTAERLCDAVALEWDKRNLRNLELFATLGFDSSSGHTNPHQHCENAENEDPNALQSLLVSSMIIIKLKSCVSDECSWINPTPQSIRFCRPLRIATEKENDLTIIREHNRLNKEISDLTPHTFKMTNEKAARVKYNVFQTLFDGKCINTIVGNKASSRCPMCLRTAHQFGNLSDDFSPKTSSLKFGLGLLHDEIKAFEHLLHISYRIKLKMWDIRNHTRGKFAFL